MTEGKPTVVSPERDVRLLSGEFVTVKPWKNQSNAQLRPAIMFISFWQQIDLRRMARMIPRY